MNNDALNHLSRTLGTGAGRRKAAGALAFGGLAAFSGLQATTARARHGKLSAEKKRKKGKRGPAGPSGPTGPSVGAVLGNSGRTEIALVSGGETRIIEIKCVADTTTERSLATGGGFVSANEEVAITASHQTPDGLGWQVRAHNNSISFASVEAWVLCLRISISGE